MGIISLTAEGSAACWPDHAKWISNPPVWKNALIKFWSGSNQTKQSGVMSYLIQTPLNQSTLSVNHMFQFFAFCQGNLTYLRWLYLTYVQGVGGMGQSVNGLQYRCKGRIQRSSVRKEVWTEGGHMVKGSRKSWITVHTWYHLNILQQQKVNGLALCLVKWVLQVGNVTILSENQLKQVHMSHVHKFICTSPPSLQFFLFQICSSWSKVCKCSDTIFWWW